MAREIGDRQGEQMALGNLGTVHEFLGHLGEALTYFEEDLKMTRQEDLPLQESIALRLLGDVWEQLGNLDEAEKCHRESASICRSVDYRLGELSAELSLGCVLFERGDLDGAEQVLRLATDSLRSLGAHALLDGALFRLGMLVLHRGRNDEAAEYLRESISLYREHENHGGALIAELGLTLAMGSEQVPEPCDQMPEGCLLEAEREVHCWYLRYRCSGDVEDLGRARRRLMEIEQHVPELYRQSMLENVRLHRDVVQAWDLAETDSA
jgi:tetratricopeptide (TPR) repeat protein